MTRYYISALGYDSNWCAIDYDVDYGDFDELSDAKEYFAELATRSSSEFFKGVDENVAYISLELEECEVTDDLISCIDILDEVTLERN